MKTTFYLTLFCWALFEIANVYFIMPIPGSQRMESIDLAYFLYTKRWIFRGVFAVLILFTYFKSQFRFNWAPPLAMVALVALTYYINFEMAADHMFLQPEQLVMKQAADNKVDSNRLVIGIVHKGEARAYPIQYIGYHHQVRDMIADQPIMVTYCTVCRSGRVFIPEVEGKREQFRLVGMDHFNAMFEDAGTGSWWRQENGVAVAGPLKGAVLPEMPCEQMALRQWLRLHPGSLVMQPDPKFAEEYDHMKNYESGRGKSDLTRTDSLSWKEKSWVVGIEIGNDARAFDWNKLKKERIVNETVGNTPIVLLMTPDSLGFAAFRRPSATMIFSLQHDTLVSGGQYYSLSGKALGPIPTSSDLVKINAYQEFWHSWGVFHPLGTRY
ncbi:MAG: DUF3179 domain-containing protein [Saprospiraceae bacterium]|nr:DUF3179 domain-containing protein [Saprospiraceae bacterium]